MTIPQRQVIEHAAAITKSAYQNRVEAWSTWRMAKLLVSDELWAVVALLLPPSRPSSRAAAPACRTAPA
jgi:hypothetical protein